MGISRVFLKLQKFDESLEKAKESAVIHRKMKSVGGMVDVMCQFGNISRDQGDNNIIIMIINN